ncbi:MAG: rhodanese [Deltaproteobacteria bacterium]|nr:rhodanese [Deltaproteobacteria bacterium]
MIHRGIQTLCAEAESRVEAWSVEQAYAAREDENLIFVDIRDVRELWRDGSIPGAVHAPRGMLEFWVDPDSPYARDFFQEEKRFLFFCASGLRSALATRAVKEMGLDPVCHMSGGYSAWKKAGFPTEARENRRGSG